MNRGRERAYAGRWVARLGDRIIAHGGTPESARRAAKKSRFKETPDIVFMPLMDALPFSPLVDRLMALLSDQETYLVGGALRDALLGRTSHDLDLVVPRGAIETGRRLASALHADFYVLDREFDTARVILSAEDGSRDFLDFSSFRAGPDLESDLRGRDFTINAIAFDLRNQTILDPLDGAADLRAGTIRACSKTSFTNDAIRILRAVRQAAAFGFKIESGTRTAMKAAVGHLSAVSQERLRDELFRMLEGPRPDASLRALEILGAFPYFLPELSAMKGVDQSSPHVHDVWEHTLSVLSSLDDILTALAPGYDAGKTNDLFTGLLTLRLGRYREQFSDHFAGRLNANRSLRALLFFAALYHDVCKPDTKSVGDDGRIHFYRHDQLGVDVTVRRAQALSLSNDEIERLKVIVANHMRFHSFVNEMEASGQGPSRRAVYRYFRDSGEGGPDLILLGLADLRGTQAHTLTQETWAAALDVARIFLENYWEKPEQTVSPPRLINGEDVMREFALAPGPTVGRLLEAIREAQAEGEISDRAEALAFGRRWLKENES